MRYAKLFLLITTIVFAGAFTQISAQTSLGDQTAAQEMERKIFRKLARLPYYGVFDHIAYKVEGERVTLYGQVAVARNKKDAEDVVEDIEGVKEVVNQIEILPLSSLDDRIRRRTLRTLAAKGLFRYLQEPNPSVRVIVKSGHITLEGFVATRGDYNLMNILANGVTDVFSVKNNLVVEKELVRQAKK